MQKKTWHRSDLWPFVACLLFAGLFTAGLAAYDVAFGTVDDGTARTAVIAGLVLAAGVALGLIDRAEAMRREEIFRTPSLDDSQRWAAKLTEELDAPTTPTGGGNDPPKAA